MNISNVMANYLTTPFDIGFGALMASRKDDHMHWLNEDFLQSMDDQLIKIMDQEKTTLVQLFKKIAIQ